MKVVLHVPMDEHGRRPDVPWPESWPPPSRGDRVEISVGSGRTKTHWVKDVTWYPEARPRAYTYVTLTTRRPGR